MQLTLRSIQYHPARDAVALLMEGPAAAGNRPLWSFFLNTTQAALTARTSGATDIWSDEEARAEAQHLLDTEYAGHGFVAVLPPVEVSNGD